MNPSVNFYFDKAGKWQEEFIKLRQIVLDCHLTEELKWGHPCYTYEKKNIVLMHGFKEYCALLFFKGSLLNDPKNIMIQQTDNVQVARQVRFSNVKEITRLEPTLKNYIFQAVKIEESGVKVPLKKTKEFAMPAEFKNLLIQKPALKKAFESLTPGRQRGYLLHFSAPKQSKTREARIDKALPQILDGKGLND